MLATDSEDDEDKPSFIDTIPVPPLYEQDQEILQLQDTQRPNVLHQDIPNCTSEVHESRDQDDSSLALGTLCTEQYFESNRCTHSMIINAGADHSSAIPPGHHQQEGSASQPQGECHARLMRQGLRHVNSNRLS